MSFDFPASPSQGQEYVAIENGLTYVFINSQWVVKDQDAPSDGFTYGRKDKQWQRVADTAQLAAVVSDTAPVSAVQGQLWWNSANGNLYIYYMDGTSNQWVQINTVGS